MGWWETLWSTALLSWAYIWGNKAQSQPLIPWDSEHIPGEAFDLWSASGHLTPDALHAYMRIREEFNAYMSFIAKRHTRRLYRLYECWLLKIFCLYEQEGNIQRNGQVMLQGGWTWSDVRMAQEPKLLPFQKDSTIYRNWELSALLWRTG